MKGEKNLSNGNQHLRDDILQCSGCDDITPHLISTQYFGYFKISNLRIHMDIHDNVGWFQIQMDNVLLM